MPKWWYNHISLNLIIKITKLFPFQLKNTIWHTPVHNSTIHNSHGVKELVKRTELLR